MASELHGVALEVPVVLEIGSAFIRAGFAGEATPRHIVYPSPLADWFPAAKSPAQIDDYCEDAKDSRDETAPVHSGDCTIATSKPYLFHQYTCVQWIAKLTPLLSDIIHGKLLVKPKSRRILLLEPMVSPTNFRTAITHVLCGKFGFPSLLFVTGSSSAAFFSIGTSHGLLVDVGHAEARCAINFGGRYVPQTFQAVPCGYENVVHLFQSYTTEPQIKNSISDASIILYNATIAMGGVPSTNQQQLSDRSENILEASPESDSIEFILPSSGSRALLDKESIQAAWSEILDVTNDTSIPHMILCSLLQCPMDLRKIIAKEMLLVGGGGCMIQGFQERILHELHRGIQNVSKFQKLRILDLRFHEVPFAPDLIPWIGLSIMGTLRLSDEKWIYRDTWVEWAKSRSPNDMDFISEDSNSETPHLIYDWLHS